MFQNTLSLSLFILLALLGGCDQVKNTLGLDHYQPDEFEVVTNPPLELPPNYTLRPPLSSDSKEKLLHTKAQSPSNQARKAICSHTKAQSLSNQAKQSSIPTKK